MPAQRSDQACQFALKKSFYQSARAPHSHLTTQCRMAWTYGLRPFFAEPPALSPSTMKIRFCLGLFWQSANLPGNRHIERALTACHVHVLYVLLHALLRLQWLSWCFFSVGWIVFKHCPSLSVTSPSTRAYLDETNLSLVCEENLDLSLHGQNAGQTFAHVFTVKHLFLFPQPMFD